jgi:hypothetical protein
VFWGSGVDGWTLFERPAVRLWQTLQVPNEGLQSCGDVHQQWL